MKFSEWITKYNHRLLTLYRKVCFAPSQRGAASQGGGRMMGGDDDDGDAIAETQETSSR
eukprot:COSAG01_NODE_289_length_19391_cov_119.323122_9_plen_59_part_00